MTLFRPCIDLHNGQVKQIVGTTLNIKGQEVITNFTSEYPPSHYAKLFKKHDLRGGHVIMLGEGNEEAAREILQEWPKSLQIGGGINETNAIKWIDQHQAEKIIVTSALFSDDGKFRMDTLERLSEMVGKNCLVVDLSCKRVKSKIDDDHNDDDVKYVIAMKKWTKLTDECIEENFLSQLGEFCSEFLVHATNVEGMGKGIDEELISILGNISKVTCTYAGGANSINDLSRVEELSKGKVDLTFGSCLDIYGGKTVQLADCINWNKNQLLLVAVVIVKATKLD